MSSLENIEGEKGTSKKGQGFCVVCGLNPSKYKCPKCFLKTCSLTCVKKHKHEKGCDGIRCKTAYVPMTDYNESHMLSDYRLLEEISRSCDNYDRQIKERPPTATKWMHTQMRKARDMNIHLKLSPYSFTQHKMNSTFFDNKGQFFRWHIVWHFPTCDISLHKRKVYDSKTLGKALVEDCTADVVSNPALKSYVDGSDICIYMERRDQPANVKKYHKLDKLLTIKQALQGKTIVEFPEFVVVFPHESEEYESNRWEEVIPMPDRPITKHFRKQRPYRQRFPPKKKFPSPYEGKDNFHGLPKSLIDPRTVESFP